MSAKERPAAEDVVEPPAVAAADELLAAKEKSKVEDPEDDVPPDDSDDDDDGDGSDDDDSDDDDSDEDDSDDGDEAVGNEDADAGDGDGGSVDDDDDDDGDDSADSEEDEDEEEKEIEDVAAEAVEPPAVAALAAETFDGSGASKEGDERKEIEEVVAEAVETPTAVVAAPPPQVSDAMSSDHVQHLRLLEALLFAGTQALDDKELTDRLPNDADLPRLLADLAELYANRGINLVKVAGGYAFRTAPDLSEKLKIERPVTRKLSRASVETLAIIAFHQPVTRAEIEQVRGVGLSKGTLDLLFEQNWIKPMGRRRAPGKPVTWGTTDFFLEHFGLSSLDDLPGHEEMRAAGLLDPRAQPPIFRPEEPDLPLEPTEDDAVEPLAVEEQGASRATGPQ